MVKNKNRNKKSDSVFNSYLREIGRHKLLTFEEELELSDRIENGDKEALNTLVNANLRLVVKIARVYSAPNFSLMDLIQEGNIGLIRAAGKYDHRKGVRFCTYASWWIRQAIGHSINKNKRTVRLPQHREEALQRLFKISNDYAKTYNHWPSQQELAKYADIEPEMVDQLLKLNTSTVSLDSEINVDSDTILDLLQDDSYRPDRLYFRKSILEDTNRSLDLLKDKEKKIIQYRFALGGCKRETFRSIGKKMGLSAEAVRQIEIRALKKLKSKDCFLRDYLLA